VGYRKEETNVF